MEGIEWCSSFRYRNNLHFHIHTKHSYSSFELNMVLIHIFHLYIQIYKKKKKKKFSLINSINNTNNNNVKIKKIKKRINKQWWWTICAHANCRADIHIESTSVCGVCTTRLWNGLTRWTWNFSTDLVIIYIKIMLLIIVNYK
jgi:hypothetical protein